MDVGFSRGRRGVVGGAKLGGSIVAAKKKWQLVNTTSDRVQSTLAWVWRHTPQENVAF